MRRLIWFILTIATMNSAFSQEKMYCLKRETPSNVTTYDRIHTRELATWGSTRILIHKESNSSPECQDINKRCHVAEGTRITMRNAGKLVEATFDSSIPGKPDDVIYFSLDGSRRFLYADTDQMAIFIAYVGNRDCNANKYKYVGKCDIFKVETYPISTPTWNSYRPDSTGLTWTPVTSPTGCADSEGQPGGGGGHDPPP